MEEERNTKRAQRPVGYRLFESMCRPACCNAPRKRACAEGVDSLGPKVRWFLVLFALFFYLWVFSLRLSHDNSYLIHVTGFIAIIVGLFYSVLVDADIYRIACQLYDDTTMQLDESRLCDIKQKSRWISVSCQVVVGILTISGVHLIEPSRGLNLEIYVASFLFFPGLVGSRIGRILANVASGCMLTREETILWSIVPNHPDEAGGLGRLGIFYAKQASVVMVGAVWLFIWIMLISYDKYMGLNNLSECIRLLPSMWICLGGCLLLAALVFVLPMRGINSAIISWKKANMRVVVTLRGRLRLLKRRANWQLNPITRRRVQELSDYLFGFGRISNWGIQPSVRAGIFASLATLLTSTILALVVALLLSGGANSEGFDRFACEIRKVA